MTKIRAFSFVILILLFGGCGSTTNLNPQKLLSDVRWVLHARMGGSIELSQFGTNLPTLDFLEGGNLSGFTGCNNFSGGFSVEDSNLTLDTGAITKKACPGTGEADFISALEKVTNFRVEKEKLILLDGVTELMSFIPKED